LNIGSVHSRNSTGMGGMTREDIEKLAEEEAYGAWDDHWEQDCPDSGLLTWFGIKIYNIALEEAAWIAEKNKSGCAVDKIHALTIK